MHITSDVAVALEATRTGSQGGRPILSVHSYIHGGMRKYHITHELHELSWFFFNPFNSQIVEIWSHRGGSDAS